jgi:hypothetical protein
VRALQQRILAPVFEDASIGSQPEGFMTFLEAAEYNSSLPNRLLVPAIYHIARYDVRYCSSRSLLH